MSAARKSGVPWFLGATAVLALALLVACRGLVLGTAIGKWDVEAAYAHEFTLLADYARSFQLLLWNPLCNGGSPEYLRDNGTLSPLNLLLAFVVGGKLMSFWQYWLALWLLGGVGMLCLARHLRAPAWGGVVVALGFLFSGFYTGHAQHTSYVEAASFLPWILWRADVALLRRRWRAMLEAGALWGLSALSSYPAFAILTGCFVALWALLRCCTRDPATAEECVAEAPPRVGLGWGVLTCVIVLLVGVAVLAPTYVGMLVEGAGYTDRSGGIPRDVAVLSNAFHPGALSTMASPFLALCKVADPTLWPRCDLSMCSAYCGVLVPVLALLALWLRPRNSFTWGVLACGLLCLAAAMGEHLPVRGWLYDWLPPMRYFRHPAIFRLYWIFALCVLALLATRELHGAFGERRVRLKFLGAAVGLALAAVLAFQTVAVWRLPDESAEFAADARRALLGLWGGAVALAALAALLPGVLTLARLAPLLIGLAFVDGLQAVELSEPLMFVTFPAGPRSWRALDAQHVSSPDGTARGLERVREVVAGPHYGLVHNGGYGSKTPTLYNYGPLANHLHEPLHTPTAEALACPPWIEQKVLRESALGAERIWFAERVAEIPPTDDAFAAFSARSAELGAPPLVVHSRDSLLAPGAEASAQQLNAIRGLPRAQRLAVRVTEYTPRRLVLSLTTPASGWLWVTDRWARGWSATVNGQEQAVQGGNFLFRALQVPAGACEVRFEYEPFGFPWLLLLSWTLLASVGASSLWSALRKPRATVDTAGA